jgi:site-specific recombinase XerD
MLDKPISPLRQRMIEDMMARRFKEKVQKDYVRYVRNFTVFLGRSPDTATSEELRRYQLHLAKQQISPGSINAAIAALRFFFTVTLERPDLVRPLTTVNKPRKAPVVFPSPQSPPVTSEGSRQPRTPSASCSSAAFFGWERCKQMAASGSLFFCC